MNRPLHRDPASPAPLRYDAKFYEWQALCHVACLLQTSVLTNIRQARPEASYFQAPEVDGVVESKGRTTFIEAKSFCLNQANLSDIIETYSKFKYDELLIVSPGFDAGTVAPRNVTLVTFRPDLSALELAYQGLETPLPAALLEELSNGDHHFRFMLASRSKEHVSSFRNQVHKNLHNVAGVFREIQRGRHLGDLPVRVFWSVSRWLFPKELFFSSYANHLVRRGMVFDIDGSAIHNLNSPCEVLPARTICARCVDAAKAETLKLVALLHSQDICALQIVFSGRQGFHVYVFDREFTEPEISALVLRIQEAGIRIDHRLTQDPKALVTFPGSIHGLSMLRALPVQDLAGFSPQQA